MEYRHDVFLTDRDTSQWYRRYFALPLTDLTAAVYKSAFLAYVRSLKAHAAVQATTATGVSCASATKRDSKFFDVPEIMSDSRARVIAT